MSLKQRIAFGRKLGLPAEQAEALARLKTPEDVQDFLLPIPTNFEPEGDTCLSALSALQQNRAHCIEAAFIAAAALWMAGEKPLLFDFQGHKHDDHVVTLFQYKGCWGAISKSNHVWLRWRDPIYRSMRELALSYFHEYVTGPEKTLRNHSASPFNLAKFNPGLWVTNPADCWEVAWQLDQAKHLPLCSPAHLKRLKARDATELQAGQITQFTAPSRKKKLMY